MDFRLNKIFRAIFPLIGLVLILASVAMGDTGLGRHKKIYAVPPPGKVIIDGKLDDWDLSGQILMYVVSETSEMQSARVRLDVRYRGSLP